MELVELKEVHYNAVKAIYMEGIATGNATFQSEAPAWEEWDKAHLPHSRLIAQHNGNIMGWAALSGVSKRDVYAGLAEVSVYVGKDHRGKGLGDILLKELIISSEKNNIWTLQAGIFPENKASLQLHEKNDFRLVGTREKIGKMGNLWRDTVLLERRSKIIGV